MTAQAAVPDLHDVSIVMLSHNRREVVGRNLAALIDMAGRTGCELVVVDNGSNDGSAEAIGAQARRVPEIRFIANPTNLGVAVGRNIGWQAATRGCILNIDDDTLVTPEAIATLLELLERRPDLGIVSPRILHATTGAAQLAFAASEYRLANFHGACHLVRRAVVEAIGLNDEGCTFGGEELDYSIRARAAGFDVAYVGRATVLHDNFVRAGAAGRQRHERWVYNFTRVFYKHFPLGMAVPLSLRYLVGHLVAGARSFGPLFALRLLSTAAQGARDGRRRHVPIPVAVAGFYGDPDLRPEFGNVPIWRKLWKRLAA